MKFSMNIQGNNTDGTATNGYKSQINEELKMNNVNTAIQLNTGTMGTFKSTLRLVGGLALAGMVAMAATFGSVSADSPSKPTSFIAHGPNEMDIEYLNKLSNVSALGTEYIKDFIKEPKVTAHFNLGPDGIDPSGANAHFNLGPDVVDHNSATVRMPHGPDVVDLTTATTRMTYGLDVVELRTGSTRMTYGLDIVEPSASAFRGHGPDVVETSSASTYVMFGPDVVETSISTISVIHGPDTAEWIG